MQRLNLINKKFNDLKVIRFESVKYTRTYWLCQCICGNLKIIMGKYIKNGNIKSCGCRRLKHGDYIGSKPTCEWKSWDSLKQRCTNSNNKDYHNYGGRGIKVCKSWLNSYKLFLQDMGRKPSIKHSIDRINNDGNYEPSNCRWSTMKEQSNNTRRQNAS